MTEANTVANAMINPSSQASLGMSLSITPLPGLTGAVTGATTLCLDDRTPAMNY